MSRGFREERGPKGANYVKGRIVLSLRRDLEDPVLVYCKGEYENVFCSFEDAVQDAEVDGYELTDEELEFLEEHEAEAEEWSAYVREVGSQAKLRPGRDFPIYDDF